MYKNIGKMGLLISFVSAVAYELTGNSSIRAFSLATALLSLIILSSYLIQIKNIGKTKDVVGFLRLLK